MPRAAQTPEEVEMMRSKILDESVKLIIEDGFSKLSMRKIASRMGMTAANIYYYFANKDEINIKIRERGFQILYDKMLAGYKKHRSPKSRYRSIVKTFVEFGINNPDYYDVMYNLRTPKYTNYVGSKLEGAASDEKIKSTRTMQLSVKVMAEMMGIKKEQHSEDLSYKAIVHWSKLHGIISLYNSKVLYETAENDREILDKRVGEVIDMTIASCTAYRTKDK